jgi:ankyrin repeat protein
VIYVLLEAGAEINEQDRDGRTALIYAASDNSNPRTIYVLLAHGADAKTRDNFGKLAVDYAAENAGLKDTDAYKQLEAAGPAFPLIDGFIFRLFNSIKNTL